MGRVLLFLYILGGAGERKEHTVDCVIGSRWGPSGRDGKGGSYCVCFMLNRMGGCAAQGIFGDQVPVHASFGYL